MIGAAPNIGIQIIGSTVSMAGSAWDELTLLTEKFHRLRLNYEQCLTPSVYRDELEREMEDLRRRQAELIAHLCATIPDEVAAA
jgi:hypothetical protein